ncbi:MAG: hypothetical protein KF730_15955 [Sphingomonas sp.]|uniref:hypothetical protein n=1 Tax=Sphingomonas sp. TaxID=28214 RepID=UPI0025EDC521|nr:hypothetical protein [Sphingomonas sp.]MBX3566060.1 hypothetical protein [Sphingomonas sp.]
MRFSREESGAIGVFRGFEWDLRLDSTSDSADSMGDRCRRRPPEIVPEAKKPRFSAGFRVCFEKKTENYKSVLTESEAAHRSHSTDAVLFNGAAELVTKNQAPGSPSKKRVSHGVGLLRSLTL